MKNLIISILLVYIFSSLPGWSCTGIEKNVICVLLTIFLYLLFIEFESIIKDIKKGVLFMNFEKVVKNIIIDHFKNMIVFSNNHQVTFFECTNTLQNFSISYTKNDKNFSMDGTINKNGNIRFKCDTKKEI